MSTGGTLFVTRNELEDILPIVCRELDPGTGQWHKQTVVEVGPPGTGKTTTVFSLAKSPSLLAWYNELTGLEMEAIPVYVTACHPDATAPEVFGQYLPLDGNWTFIPGAMLRAWGYNWDGAGVTDPRTGYDEIHKVPAPGIHLLDDIHLMGPGGQSAMYKAMDNGVGGNYLDPFGKLVFPHPASLCFGTMNGEIDSLDPAVVDRTAVKVPVMEPSQRQLERLAEDMQELCAADYDDNMSPIATYREWLSISNMRPHVGLAKAVMLALGDRERTRKMVEALAHVEAKGIFGTGKREARDALSVIVNNTPAGAAA